RSAAGNAPWERPRACVPARGPGRRAPRPRHRRRYRSGASAIIAAFPSNAAAMLSRAEFAALAAQGYNRIPLVREVHADLDTPLSVYLKFADGPYAYLFESIEGGETWGRHSIIGLPARRVIEVRGNVLRECDLGAVV